MTLIVSRSAALRALAAAVVIAIWHPMMTNAAELQFKQLPNIQFIAASVDPNGPGAKATSGSGAQDWGIWRVDPGPRGVRLVNYKQLEQAGGVAPAGWKFNRSDWWLEEHGLIMEAPDFPIPAGRYLVTGGRETTAVLTISKDNTWELSNGARLYDVTHLPCRSARYTPNGDGSPATANPGNFPVKPGASMPTVEGTNKHDYSVIFVTAIEA
mmetsp:Transcript_32323/g.53476  ORF Transcript_32323/g.53476 Transcript_32323/m.53476 type:complete len:212 (-) Transcript_32323:95-730(-)|eukprot:CAMPEP_0119313228 /NCGR_PEP_ID=MMETSP1333-20130426/28403_1 /TAXON_ID=418940 /ORGANISM="Scyphosphaera apsteinii, Strain RCC1455" /LENGTH=211 /DNA_ID=CAMNT_0007318021 /DNA_START=61 /DNA_END=696 /DNA_ORIENTATION=-